jgi:hypothetical protein
MQIHTWTWVAAVISVYLLASGPIFRLAEDRMLPDQAVSIAYAPLYPLSKVPVVRGVIRVYVGLWMHAPAR